MAVNPITSESLTLDFRSLMKIPVSDRVKAASIDQNFAQSILTALTPIQIAKAFPDYFRRQLPDISNFVTSNIVARNGGVFNQTGGGAGGSAYPYYDGETKPSGVTRPAGAPPPTIKEMKEKLLQKGIDVDNVYSAVKQGSVLESDERLKFLKGSSKEELEKMGLERFQDANGKTLIRMVSVPAESLTLQQAEQKLREESSLNAGLDADSKLIKARTVKTSEALGIDQRQYNAFRQALANIESTGGEYGVIGGAGNNYSGAYQFGSAAMLDSAKALGMNVPSREEFLKNPELQEQFLDQYTALNHKTLMRVSPEYKNMTPEERLGVLGYAHNQGAGGAANWLKTGVVGSDAFGTKGTKYIDEIRNQLNETKEQVVSDPNKQYTEEEIKTYIQQLTEKQREELVEGGIRYQYGKASPTSSEYIQDPNDPRNSTILDSRVAEEQAGFRRLPIKPELKNSLDYAAEMSGIEVEVFSGGQDHQIHDQMEAAGHVSSYRHNIDIPGTPGAADVVLYYRDENGKKIPLSVTNPEHAAKVAAFTENFTRVVPSAGVGSNYMKTGGYIDPTKIHYGGPNAPGGQATTWGNMPDYMREAHQRGVELRNEDVKSDRDPLKEWIIKKEEEKKKREEQSKTAENITPKELPVPQMALGGNIYGVNEDITLVNTNTGEPIAQVNDNERIEKQGNAIQVTPETKLKADELTQKYDTSSEMEDRMADIEGRVNQQQEIAGQNIRKANAPEKVQNDAPQKWREAVVSGERPVSPSFNRAMARTKFFPEGHHFNRASPSSQS